MIIIAHRGLWSSTVPENSPMAIKLAFDREFGAEIDVRLCRCGKFGLSHDPLAGDALYHVDDLRRSLGKIEKLPLLVNVKESGVMWHLKVEMGGLSERPLFFDILPAEIFHYLECGFPVLARIGDLEPSSKVSELADGLWVDGVTRDWPTGLISTYPVWKKARNGPVCFVSPELHKREHLKFWKRLKSFDRNMSKETRNNIMLCTDYPIEARRFFDA